jgi:hypothetical protein
MKRLYRLAGYRAGPLHRRQKVRELKKRSHPAGYMNPIISAGWVSKLRSPSGNATQGCLLRVQKCTVGRSQEVSFRVPPRTLRIVEPGVGARQTHEPHSGQTQRVVTRPLSAVRWTARGSPWMRRQAPSARTTAIENALLVMRWQSVQWQVDTSGGAWVIS